MLRHRRPCLLRLSFFVLSLSRDHLLFTNAKAVTRYIDDSYGDPVTGSKPIYFPEEYHAGQPTWKNQSCGTDQGCLIVHDTRRTYDQTYTAATYQPAMGNMGFHLQFQGTGIAVYFILANNEKHAERRTECNFMLDGSFSSAYSHLPQVGNGTQYNTSVYREEGLENREHVLSVETGIRNFSIHIAFDYATYTTEVSDEETSSASNGPEQTGQTSSRPSTGVIVGGAVGAVVLATGAIVNFVVLRKWQRSRATHDVGHIAPFTGRDTRPLLQTSPDGGLSRKAQLMQQEINRMREDLSGLQRQRAHPPPTGSLSEDGSREISELREQVRRLQEQLGSSRTRSNAPPPEYTG
ncbi:hypothetical protein V5O48_008455 [Marasmius crinis-equi]|uniref:Uncharacterized protein n=1 Tax=Marasmius crinis-equi TaxID=585013 RepID=A0ABR3FDV5_9AGAR